MEQQLKKGFMRCGTQTDRRKDMIITLEERTRLRSSVEQAVVTASEGSEKHMLLTLLALLHDLDEAERRFDSGSIEALLKRVLHDLSQTPLTIDEAYVRNFSHMAENLNALAKKVWGLKITLDAMHTKAVAESRTVAKAMQ